MIRFAALGSGSKGNALLVESGSTRVLVDCGFTVRETEHRLARLGRRPEDVTAVLVTHEHSDHSAGAVRFAAHAGAELLLTQGTFSVLGGQDIPSEHVRLVDSHEPFEVGDLAIEPYPVPHDAREPVQFVFGDGGLRLGLLTDAGSLTPHIRTMLSGCHGLILECNHDPEMLARSTYPPALKKRIGGAWGHLDNASAARLLAAVAWKKLGVVVAAHLSEQNNRPALARSALAGALDCALEEIVVADQGEGFDWLELR